MKKYFYLNKIWLLICILSFVLCILISCKKNQNSGTIISPSIDFSTKDINNPSSKIEKPIMTEEWLDKYPVSQEEEISTLNMKSYPLEDLKSYFGIYSSVEYGKFGGWPEHYSATINEINEKYLIQNVRYYEGKYYTIYKVEEGGYFYIFWGMTSNLDCTEYSIKVYDKFYINELNKKENFTSIEKGSTFEDILIADPWADLVWINNTVGSLACSLLEDGSFLVYSCIFVEDTSINGENRFLLPMSSPRK